MTRRDLIATTLAAAIPAAADSPKPSYFELRYYRMRTDRTEQPKRTIGFLTGSYLPAAKRAGAGPIGLFSPSIAPGAPFVLCLTTHPSLASVEIVRDKLAADADYQKGLAEYNAGPDQGFMTQENTLLRAFDSFPGVEQPPVDAKRPARIFELRTYSALNETYEQRKIKMFGAGGEINIFKKLGMQPTWCGEAIAGVDLPHISYMLGYENLATREKMWQAFGGDPDWVKLRTNPEYSMPGLSSNISNSILSVVNGSEIR